MKKQAQERGGGRAGRGSRRFRVWIWGCLLGTAIASYLASRVYGLNESIQRLSRDEVLWSGDQALGPAGASLWSRWSLAAVILCALGYLVAVVGSHLRARAQKDEAPREKEPPPTA